MTLESAIKIAPLLAASATAVTAIVAIAALCIAATQIKAARKSQREATAKDIYRDYLKLAFENPAYADPRVSGEWDQEKADWLVDQKYRWFVAFALNSCDEAVDLPNWREVILTELKFHEDYLSSVQFKEEDGGWKVYSDKLKDIWESVGEPAVASRAKST
jgi:hypothetical protein